MAEPQHLTPVFPDRAIQDLVRQSREEIQRAVNPDFVGLDNIDAPTQNYLRFEDGITGGWVNEISGSGTVRDRSVSGRFAPNVNPPSRTLEAYYNESVMIRNGIDIVIDDCILSWRTFDGQKASDMAMAERKNHVKRKIAAAMRSSDIYGGSLIHMRLANRPMLSEFDPRSTMRNELLGLDVVKGPNVSIQEFDMDPMSMTYGEPLVYVISQTGQPPFKVHASQCLRFVANPDLADRWELYHRGWGISTIVRVMQEIKRDQEVMADIAHMVTEASLKVLSTRKFDQSYTKAAHRDPKVPDVHQKLREQMNLQSIYRALVIDEQDTFDRKVMNFGGIPAVVDRLQLRCAAAFKIPATRYLAQSPAGENATGESDMRNYDLTIESRKENELAEHLDILDQVVARSSGLGPPPIYRWKSLLDASLNDKGEAYERLSIGLRAMTEAGYLLPPETVGAALTENGIFEKIVDPETVKRIEFTEPPRGSREAQPERNRNT